MQTARVSKAAAQQMVQATRRQFKQLAAAGSWVCLEDPCSTPPALLPSLLALAADLPPLTDVTAPVQNLQAEDVFIR